MKKILATILALVMALGLTATAWAAQPTPPAVAEMGVTTYNDLHTALEAAKNGGTVKLLRDVELTDTWTPVGDSTTPFKGTFDGGEAAGGITVKLEKLINYATVMNTESEGPSRAAGIIAQVTSGANVTITKCVNNGAITTNNGYAGGIVAAKQGGSKVSFENCSNAGTLTGNYTGSLIAWLVGGNWLSMTNSGDARAAIGAVNISGNEGYTFYFTIDGEEYYIRKQGGEEDSDTKFSALWDGKKTIDRAYMERIIKFFNYAKGPNPNFRTYPSNCAELFAYAWNTSDHTRMDSMFGAEGWPELLSAYNTAKEDNMTPEDFAVIWNENILYSAPAPAPTPDPTPSTGGYYSYPSTTTNDTTKGSPKTFDAGVGIYAVTAVLSVTGMAWTAKKRGN